MFFDNFKFKFLIIVAFLIAAFFSFYKLAESPHVWIDEGIITQVSRNIADYGKSIFQVAPDDFISASFVTTGYTVTYPVGLMFKLFGVGVLQARLVMIIFILLFFLAFYFLIKRSYGAIMARYSLFLLVSFAPVYGHGRNVLGEIPGLLFLALFLLFVDKILINEKKINFGAAGLFLGLVIVTKPIFIILVPAVLISLYFFKREALVISLKNKNNLLIFTAPLAAALLVWFITQFSGESISSIWSFYSNPYAVNLKEAIILNLQRFFKEVQPLYFLGLMCVWSLSFIIRYKEKIGRGLGETIAFIFSWLIFLAYLRTPGFYRYFFPGELLALVYLSSSLFYIFKGRVKTIVIYTALILLILLQFYQTLFHSWVADYYNSVGTSDLNRYFEGIDRSEEIFIYQAPEILLFLSHNNYYQYIEITDKVHIGEKNLPLLASGLIKKVIIFKKSWGVFSEQFSRYKVSEEVDKYFILTAD
jgi:hypothetical protein